MKHRVRWAAGFVAAALVLTAAATAVGYTGQVAASMTVAPQGSITCAAPFTVAATILDAEGRPVAGESVAWSWAKSPSSADRIEKTPTVTNADGVATTTVALANVTGTREIRATAGDVRASAVLNAACGGLPITSTDPATGGPATGIGGVALVGLAIVFLVSFGVALRRRSTAGG